MESVFDIINAIFIYIFYPFRDLSPSWGMIWISLLTGIVMLIVFRATSNQEGIRKAKAKVSAYILEMRLYNHDLGKMLSSLGKTFTANIFYLRYMVIPLVIIIIPVLIVLIQVSYRYEHRPIKTGEQTIIKAVLKPDFPVLENPVTLNVPENIEIRTPALRITSLNEVNWRIIAHKAGIYELGLTVNGAQYNKNFHVESGFSVLGAKRAGSSFSAFLLNHSEPKFPDDSPFIAVEIVYPDVPLSIMGFSMHWIVWFFICSVLAGFALKNVFRVEL